MKNYVLDACALVAFFNNEDGADIVENLLNDAGDGNCVVTMNKYNLLEVFTDTCEQMANLTPKACLVLLRT